MSQRYNLYRDSNCMDDNKGVAVKRCQDVTRQEIIMRGSLTSSQLDSVMLALRYLETTIGVESVEFDTGCGMRYLLEKA